MNIHSGNDRSIVFEAVREPFENPYGVLVSAKIANLMFAGRCVSCDKGTLAAIHIMPQCMNMGEDRYECGVGFRS